MMRLFRNLSYIARTYDFKQAIPNLRRKGLITFMKNTLREVTGIQIGKKNKKRKTINNDYFNYLFKLNNERDGEYVPISHKNLPASDIKLIAFYLPQFHPIPENDTAWGKGFTEWTNVTRAVPQFITHYQPRLPGELGFYDLRIKEVQKRQIELAEQYGIYGFCFHFYWFNDKTVLEDPIERFADNYEFPFCLNWANENWSRRWDGSENEILIAQNHSPEDDIKFISHISKYLKKENYIKIKNKPLLLIYRPSLFPDPKGTGERWRRWCSENGIGEIYLATVHSHDYLDPDSIGFDAAIDFPPNMYPLKYITSQFDIINPNYHGQICDYREFVEIGRKYIKPKYMKFRGVCPSWDNEARKPGRGGTLVNSSPRLYGKWLRTLCDFTRANFEPDERLIFINAWNEWAEGAYLEPDRRYGYAYLDKTAEVISSQSVSSNKGKILFVSHDARKGGAQAVLLNIISWFRRYTFMDIKILCLDVGEWLPKFEELGEVLVLSELRNEEMSNDELFRRLREFCSGPPDLIYGNTAVAGREYGLLKQLDAPIITHFHEMAMSIERYAAGGIDGVLKKSTHIIACSKAVLESLVKKYSVDPSKISTVYSSINPDNTIRILNNTEKLKIRKKLGIDENKFLVFGCGIGMPLRKGGDLFIDVVRELRKRGYDGFHFYWIGDFDRRDPGYRSWLEHMRGMRKGRLDKYVTFLGLKDKPREYLQAGDIFLLSSREDPFPLVALEAAECGLPIICFADAGGIPEFVDEDTGFVVPYEDVEAVAERVAILMENKDMRLGLGGKAREKLLSQFTVDHTAPHILSVYRRVAQKKPAVSVIVPNYNHARYLQRRLDTIFNQTYKDFEVILLDDASTDNSMDIIEKYAHHADIRIIRNDRNSGSPCAQWLKGIDLARADIIWIAESDDACEPAFLETLIPVFQNPEVKLAYADSYVIDENNRVTGDYINSEYLTSLSGIKWKKSYQLSATEEINDGLGVKNTILNISAALFRKVELDEYKRKTLESMGIAGDWYFIVNAIKNGKVHYEAMKLNYHRRHMESVIGKTVSEKKIGEFFREFATVQEFIFQNYQLSNDFDKKWEEYLRRQWNDFYPNRPFSQINEYYPMDKMRAMIHRGYPGGIKLNSGSQK